MYLTNLKAERMIYLMVNLFLVGVGWAFAADRGRYMLSSEGSRSHIVYS